jgi:tetratricopeptide (TPR) repeat protein
MKDSRQAQAAKIETLLDRGDLVGASRLLQATGHRDEPRLLVCAARLLRLRGQQHEAMAAIEQALQIAPDCSTAWVEAARLHANAGEIDRACTAFQRAYSVNDEPGPWTAEWIELLSTRGHLDEALRMADAYCKRAPKEPSAWFHLGLANQLARRYQQALAAYARVRELAPAWPMLRNNEAAVHLEMGDWVEAQRKLEDTVIAEPGNALAWNNLAVALLKLLDLPSAQVAVERALALAPHLTNALQTYAQVLKELQQWDAALAAAQHALELAPHDPGAMWSLAMLELARGDDRNGWLHHEARWEGAPELRDVVPKMQGARWTGEPLTGKTLLVWGEQGFGEVMQFVRFVPAIAERVKREGGRLVYCCFADLHSLIARSLGDVVDTIVADDASELAAYDYHLPLASLPLMLSFSNAQLPVATRYLRPDDALVRQWERRLGAPGGARRLRVGLVWSGGVTHQRNPLRSVHPLAYAEAFGHLADVEFVCLQLGAQHHVQAMRRAGLALKDAGEHLHSFDDTAALLANLDLVITVCTSVAHLAGAMGVPAWVLLDVNPHWIWMTEREDSPWYPSVKLYRQPAYRQWTPVLERVAADLARLKTKGALPPVLAHA